MQLIFKYYDYGRDQFMREYDAIRTTFYCFLATDLHLDEIRSIGCVKDIVDSRSLVDAVPDTAKVLDFERRLFNKFWTVVSYHREQGKEPDWDALVSANYEEVKRFVSDHAS
jgi:hypothetical protein